VCSSDLCDQWEYYNNDDDFKSYVDTYSAPKWAADTAWPNYLPTSLINTLKSQVQTSYEDAPGFGVIYEGTSDYVPTQIAPDYPTTYRKCKPPEEDNNPKGYYTIPSCVFNWTSLVLAKKLTGGDPCRYHIGDGDAIACIGDWTGSRFKDYWCEDYGRAVDLQHYMQDHSTEVDRIKYVSSWVRSERSVTTLAAFYRHNTYLLYMQVCGLIVTCIVLYFEHFHALVTAPKDGEKLVEA
jgi:hypothetical protein